jgi:replicative DNA helicase
VFAAAAAVVDAGAAPTLHLVEAELERRGTLDSVGRGFVRELANAMLVPGQAPALARLVAQHARRRQLKRFALRAVQRVRDGGDLAEIEADLAATLKAQAPRASVELVFEPLEDFVAVDEIGTDPLVRAAASSSLSRFPSMHPCARTSNRSSPPTIVCLRPHN